MNLREYEYYEILKDGHHFAGFNQGDETRDPSKLISYHEFLEEFQACRRFWNRHHGLNPDRWTYRITLRIIKKGL